jgi:hypothetical protein
LIVRTLEEKPEEIPALLSELDDVRRVAVIHTMFALADDWDEPDEYIGRVEFSAALALLVAETWNEVVLAKERWRELGIAMTRDDVRTLRESAMRAAAKQY